MRDSVGTKVREEEGAGEAPAEIPWQPMEVQGEQRPLYLLGAFLGFINFILFIFILFQL